MRLTQAPVVHGYSISLWFNFEKRPDLAELETSLASKYIEVRSRDLDAPTNVGATGQHGLIAGEFEVDRNHPQGVWMWVVMDNFRMIVDNAMDVARVVLPS
jgi:aspartate-semialdehyde dehydrogenase